MWSCHTRPGYCSRALFRRLTNRRTDAIGGSLANRLRFPLEVFEALRRPGRHKPMSCASRTDWEKWYHRLRRRRDRARFAKRGPIGRCLNRTDRAGRPASICRMSRHLLRPGPNRGAGGRPWRRQITTAIRSTPFSPRAAPIGALGRPHLVDPSFTLKAAAGTAPSRFCPPHICRARSRFP